MEERLIKRMIQIGTVTDLDASGLKVRVLFKASGMTSGWLPVLQHTGASLNITTADGHTHTGSTVNSWMPRINDTVLCLYPPIAGSDGYVIGRCP